jgi:hypothetical protein
MRQPVLNIHQMTTRHTNVKNPIAHKLIPIATSACPKNAHRKPEIKYTTGLNNVTVCQIGGSIEIE